MKPKWTDRPRLGFIHNGFTVVGITIKWDNLEWRIRVGDMVRLRQPWIRDHYKINRFVGAEPGVHCRIVLGNGGSVVNVCLSDLIIPSPLEILAEVADD